MEGHFSEIQRELHLPQPDNNDPLSPENTIIAYNVPSICRYAWYSRHHVELECQGQLSGLDDRRCFIYPLSKFFHKMDGLSLRSSKIDLFGSQPWRAYLVKRGPNGPLDISGQVLQEFDEVSGQLFPGNGKVLSLPWFFSQTRNELDMILYDSDRLIFVFEVAQYPESESPVEVCGSYQSITGSQGMHKTRDGGYPLVLSEAWYPITKSDRIEFDSILGFYFHGLGDLDRISLSFGDYRFCDCSKDFLTREDGKVLWLNYIPKHQIHPGVPSKFPFTVELDGKPWADCPEVKIYIQVCQKLDFYAPH